MTLADPPSTWPDGPAVSTLETLAIFVGIPLLVILAVSLLVYAPSWVHGPRYRPGQPWDSTRQWFGTSLAADPSTARLERGSAAGRPEDERPGTNATPGPEAVRQADQASGGASAGW